MTLAEFLLARIAEDEATSRAATPGPWAAVEYEDYGWEVHNQLTDPQLVVVSVGHNPEEPAGGGADGPDTFHIVRWDPARVLAESAAKRRIIAIHTTPKDDPYECAQCVQFHADAGCENELYPCLTLRALALPYTDHPDYLKEWAV